MKIKILLINKRKIRLKLLVFLAL